MPEKRKLLVPLFHQTTCIKMVLLLFVLLYQTCGTSVQASEMPWCSHDEFGHVEGSFVKCSVKNANDVFAVDWGVQPDRVIKMKVMCDMYAYHSFTSHHHWDPTANHNFGIMKNIRELYIDNCKMETMPLMAFNGLSRLANVTLKSRNYLYPDTSLKLTADTFSQLQSLVRLDLAENKIRNLPQTLLCPLQKLQSLNLTMNDISDISSVGLSTGSRDNVLCMVDVQIVHLSHNRIKVLTNKGFAAANKLTELRLDHNSISRADEGALIGLKKLTILDLSSNQMIALSPVVLKQCTELLELYLQNNSINVLPTGLFQGLQYLNVLDLSRNEISSSWLGSDTFSDQIRLKLLDLSFNRLARIDATIFRNQYGLIDLRLNNNEIEMIADNAFVSSFKLNYLSLDHNKIRVIYAGMLNGLSTLNSLTLTHNSISDIHPDGLYNISSVMEVKLGHNELQSVPTALQHLLELRSLDLSHNQIMDIKNASYLGLVELYNLDLGHNYIGNLTAGLFDDLPNLRILNLNNNNISGVDQHTFDPIAELHALRLDSNNLIDVNNLFTNIHDLLMLNISSNKIEWFDYALVPIGIHWLDMHDNRIEVLGNFFELGKVLKLRTLDVSSNRLREIQSSSLPDGIEIVYMNKNRIKKIDPFAFMGKPNLTRVDLTKNQLESLEVNAFRLTEVRNRKPLPEFFISDNPYLCDCNMEWIQRTGFMDDSRQYPRMVDISNITCDLPFYRKGEPVPLLDVPLSQFLCTYQIHCFALCHCCEFDACDCEMTCPDDCTCYYDQSWNTNIVDCSNSNHTVLPEKIPMDATELYLDGNDIQDLSTHAFIGRKNMRTFYLNNSNVNTVNNNSFNGLKQLLTLHMEFNMLPYLQGFEFDCLKNVRQLYLSFNRISYIANNSFDKNKKLEVLYLDHNFVTQFDMPYFDKFVNLVEIRLSDNPWDCDCQFLDDFGLWLGRKSDSVSDLKTLSCVYNDTYSVPYYEFNVTKCTNFTVAGPSYIQSLQVKTYLPLIIGGSSSTLLLIIIVALIIIYRKKMGIWFFSRYGVRIFSSDANVLQKDDKLFDAFISYSKKDEAFVYQVLAAHLEAGTPRYQLCLHYRDLPVNQYVSDAITEAVESSRRTLLVVSENFLRSEWNRYDFKTAHLDALNSNIGNLVLIIAGNVVFADLDPDMQVWMKTCTTLTWGDKRFWEKLKYLLPDTRDRIDEPGLPTHQSVVHI